MEFKRTKYTVHFFSKKKEGNTSSFEKEELL